MYNALAHLNYSIMMEPLVPALNDVRRVYVPSIAASKDRMVSSGRSRRGRVGFDRSGSAFHLLVTLLAPMNMERHTDYIPIYISVLKMSN